MEITVKTKSREEIVDITKKVREAVDKASDEDSKACLVFVPHTTCAIIINEISDERVGKDLLNFLSNLTPKGGWLHDNGDGNGDAHVKASIIGLEKVIPIQNGLLQLGKWQSIALAEFDGPKERKIIVRII